MASPSISISTASSAGSPAAIAPAPQALAIKATTSKMNPVALGVGLAAAGLVTRKEWVIPPRPKPGRKPATDTPPTKRKAQNRAAQRAFRERRAARVGELEEQLEEVKEEQQNRQAELTAKVQKLEADVERFSGQLHSWRLRCDTLDRIADYERRQKEAALAELAFLRKDAQTTRMDAVPLPSRNLRHQVTVSDHQETQLSPDPEPETKDLDTCGGCTSTSECACIEQALDISCGDCGPDTNCACLEESMKAIASLKTPLDLKRSHSPVIDSDSDKRQRLSEPSTPLEVDFTTQRRSEPSTPLEIDFTAQFSSKIRSAPIEPCGFCEEGTYCVCAEIAATGEQRENRLAPLLNEVTPPPSETGTDGNQTKLPPLQPNSMHPPVAAQVTNSCINGPGTCQQCQADPRSGNFCRSLAALRASGSKISEGCCGGNGNGGDCCKSTPVIASAEPPPSLSCADTYKTLSTHRNFDQANDELNTWLGRLHATPPAHIGRAPIEVEAASVMGVLKLFDRRFGRG